MTDEYEVDLMDYLRVIWNWKWVIVACFVVAVAVAAAVSYTQPDRYAGTVTYQLNGLGSTVGIYSIDSTALVTAATAIDPAALGSNVTLTVHKLDNQVAATITGAVTPAVLRTMLTKVSPLLTAGISNIVRRDMAQALALAKRSQAQLSAESAILRGQMTTTSSPDLSAAIAERIADLALQIAQVKVQIDSLTTAHPTDLFTLNTTGEPTITRVGPHRHLNIAVAAVLGLFVGILLAFFLNYIVLYQHRGT